MPHVSPIPLEPQSAVFRAIADRLKVHPLLSGRVKTWRLRDGETTDDDPPTEGNLPWVRLTPVGLPEVESHRTTNLCPIQVDVEIATRRADGAEGLSDLAGRIRDALFAIRHKATLQLWSAMEAAGGSELIPGQPFLPTGQDSYGPGILIGTGNFRVNIFIRNY